MSPRHRLSPADWIRLLALAICVLVNTATAMEVRVQGNLVFATGPVEDDLVRFEAAFAQPGVDTVVLVDSPGGDLWTALRVGRIIADKGFKTIAAGQCVSACSLLFMGGRERRFADAIEAAQTYVGIHGARDRHTGQIIAAVQPEIFAFLRSRMGSKFNNAIINQALYDMKDGGAMLTIADPVRHPRQAPVHCRSLETPPDQCTVHTGETATTLGLTTHDELAKVTLPEGFRRRVLIGNRALPPEPADLTPYLDVIARRNCTTDPCRNGVNAFPGREPHRSLAAGTAGDYLAWVAKADSLEWAMLAAIYRCNHAGGGAGRLCEAELVNNHPIRHLYKEAEESHREALGRLKAPTEKHYANEQFGGSFTTASGYRTEKLVDTTPRRIEGVTTVGTQELAQMLGSERRPVVVDVTGLYDAVPGSVTLVGAGSAYSDPAKDADLARRISRLLTLLAPDKSAPVVIHAAGRDSWRAVNASLRARSAGYEKVFWYRGGPQAWQAADLPTAISVFRAVAD